MVKGTRSEIDERVQCTPTVCAQACRVELYQGLIDLQCTLFTGTHNYYMYSMRIYKYSMRFRVPDLNLNQTVVAICFYNISLT